MGDIKEQEKRHSRRNFIWGFVKIKLGGDGLQRPPMIALSFTALILGLLKMGDIKEQEKRHSRGNVIWGFVKINFEGPIESQFDDPSIKFDDHCYVLRLGWRHKMKRHGNKWEKWIPKLCSHWASSLAQSSHRWEKLSPCSIDGSSNMKKILAEHIENLQKTPSSKRMC